MTEPLTGTMIRVCMDCKRVLGTKPCAPAMDGKETHGRCDECHARFMAQLEKPEPQKYTLFQRDALWYRDHCRKRAVEWPVY